MSVAIEEAGFPVVHITAVPTVSNVMGVTRVLRGQSVTNLLGNECLSREEEMKLIGRHALRSLEILQTELDHKQMFTLTGDV
jgi:hypothetical protein